MTRNRRAEEQARSWICGVSRVYKGLRISFCYLSQKPAVSEAVAS